MPQNIYDSPDFFEGYSQLLRSREGLAGAPEWPVLREMLPPLAGARVLDLGCGFGAFARWARGQGAAHVLGVDLSQKMLAEAQARTQDTHITYQQADIEQLALPEGAFEVVYSSLALHYLENLETVFARIRRGLVSDGHFVFSVEHPIYTAPTHPGWQMAPRGDKVWALNHYFHEGKRMTDWLAPGVIKQHRTVSHYLTALLNNGFRLTHFTEWGPSPEQLAAEPDWADEVHRPIFLLVGAQVQ